MTPSLERLLAILRYRRRAGSYSERQFIDAYIKPLPNAVQDAYRNWHVRVGTTEKPILWSCHTDSVHRGEGMQRITYSERTGLVRLSTDTSKGKQKSNCLGADDGVGCWLLLEMIGRKVPGHYIFHYGEERGCEGSSDLARYRPEWLQQFDIAIAVDRRGFDDIITRQSGGRCASDAFATSLGDILNSAGPFRYSPSPNGIYTDTAEYMDLIPECTNVSVGYQGEHWQDEQTDTEHALFLLDALCAVRPELLTVARDPTEVEGWTKWSYGWDDDYLPAWIREDTDHNDTPPVDDDGVPTATYATTKRIYLDDDYARVTAHLSANATSGKHTGVRYVCAIHGQVYVPPALCAACEATPKATVRTVSHDPTALVKVNGRHPNSMLSIVERVRADRRRRYNIRKRKRPSRLWGAWAMSNTTEEKGGQS
jgi:hypothetical protein